MFFAKIAAIVAAVVSVAPVRAEDAVEIGVQLTDGNFTTSVEKGLWFVEHFSPKCGHCRAFAPTWEKLTQTHEHLQRIAGFRMAQVNCIAQGDLCNANKVRGYPQLNLYADGKFVNEFNTIRDFDKLSSYIYDNVYAYADGTLDKSNESTEKEPHVVLYRPNRKGEVTEVDATGLEALKAKGPVITKFYAPWCGHCKSLLPVYEKLATSMQGVINVAAVNCDVHSSLCKSEKITGYPTLKLFKDGEEEVFAAYPSLDKMRSFIEDRVESRATGVMKIAEKDFASVLDFDDEFFLYLTGWETTAQELDQVTSALEGLTVPVYKSSDPRFYKTLRIANPPPSSVLFSFSSHNADFVSSLSLPAEQRELERFIFRNKQPTLMDLTPENYKSIMDNDKHPLVVVGAVRQGSEGEKDRALMLKTARAWKRGGRNLQQPVWFLNVDSGEWAKWLAKTFGILPEDLPAATVIDTETREYYDITLEGHRARLSGAAMFSLLEGVHQKFLKPKKIESGLQWGTRSATASLVDAGRWSVEHPFTAAMVVVVGVFVFIFVLSRCMSRERHHGGGYMNEKGGQRLD